MPIEITGAAPLLNVRLWRGGDRCHQTVGELALSTPNLAAAKGLYEASRISQDANPCLETDKGLYLVLPLIAGS